MHSENLVKPIGRFRCTPTARLYGNVFFQCDVFRIGSNECYFRKSDCEPKPWGQAGFRGE